MQKNCLECGVNFEITNDDLDFYKKVSPKFDGKVFNIPHPKRCPDCRQQRRLAFRNEKKLFKRKCDATGKNMVSMYPADAPFPVYDNEYWWQDHWNGLKFGRDFDFNKTLFENFQDLLKDVPKMARIQQGENLNSQFCNCASYNKNCYLIFSANNDEDCMYGTRVNNCKDSLDNLDLYQSELCYECINVENCYDLKHSMNCQNCSDSYFLKNCIGCSNCFGCINLNNKKYYFFNKPLSRRKYLEEINKIDFNYKKLDELQTKLLEFIKEYPHKYMEGINLEDSTGNYLSNCKNAKYCFDAKDLWDCAYCSSIQGVKNSYDIDHYGVGEANELLYEGEGIGHGVFNMLFSKLIWGGSLNVFYSYECFKSKNIFGCTGLRGNEYCILNKQYTKEEYEKTVAKIIEHMQKTGEWGEFFPIDLSPFAYNETVSKEYFPLTKEEVLKKGWKWKDEEDKISDIIKVIPAEKLPNSIKDVPDDVLNWAIKCEKTNRPFRIQKAELEFYRKMDLPIPHFHPDVRHGERMQKRNPRKLWNRKCAKCQVDIKTTYAPEREEKVYCEECYLEEVN